MSKLVIYHANCADGFCGAYLLNEDNDPDNIYMPMHYGEDPYEAVKLISRDREVILVDFSFKRDVILAFANMFNSVTILDHHKTTAEELDGTEWPPNVDITFDMERSGAQLAWEYLYPGLEEPSLVQYVADRDFWKFELPESQEISAYIRSFPFTFTDWAVIDENLSENFQDCVDQGAAILRYQRQQIEQAFRTANQVQWQVIGGTYKVGVTNSTVNFSEVAGQLAELHDFGVCWFKRKDGKYQYSLRSRNDKVDVSEVAKFFGGGGHRNAAGFETDYLIFN